MDRDERMMGERRLDMRPMIVVPFLTVETLDSLWAYFYAKNQSNNDNCCLKQLPLDPKMTKKRHHPRRKKLTRTLDAD